ncbi:hypothetical protein [Coleofasciculus sp. FACHB-1120]|uniref:hypothetical protein n=1 Tax=Coleofasciculus sp. FACHB-1120 TaxID=2692783 RepID=UPI00168556F7|nr:hypothetical protein [Coleofasciculus sp. FACHB-1120]MBD2742999.1 hypothetical protein [Coleofasciculus sp. FACHB-1120]
MTSKLGKEQSGNGFQKMSAVSQNGWDSWRMASIAIARNARALEQLSEKLTSKYTDSEMAGIWRQARLVLAEEDECWLEEELYRILIQDSQLAA